MGVTLESIASKVGFTCMHCLVKLISLVSH